MTELLERRSFIGRGVELQRLHAALREATAGTGRAVIVAGEAGIGKSRLLDQFAEAAAEEGALVLQGACVETADGTVPYAPFVEILRDLVRATPSERLPALLGPGRAELARLLPEIALRAADVPPPAELDRAAQARLFELILGVFERLAVARPLVLEVEDVHAADRSTRELLAFLVRALRDDRVLFVLALRIDTQGAAVGNLSLVAELEREAQVERVDVGPFGRDEVEAQVASLLDAPPDADTVDRLLGRSDGNPFYVEELVLAGGGLDGDLPPVLRDVLVARIASLSEPAHGVLRAAAAAGRRIDDELLAGVLELPIRTLAAALREAVESGILVRRSDRPGRDGPAVEFRHALLQEVVQDELFPAERMALHASFAAALEARAAAWTPGGEPAPPPAEIARHWDAARRPDRALGPTTTAAEAAEHVYAFPEAHRLWARAAALAAAAPEAATALGLARDTLMERAADAAVLAGAYREAIELGGAAIALVDLEADPARAAHLHDRLRWYRWEAGDRRAAVESVEAALRLFPSDVPSVGRARALAHHAGILLYAGDYDGAAADARAAIEVARAVDSPGEEAFALGVLGWSLAVLGDPDAGLDRFREGQAIAERLGSVEGIALATFNLASLLDRIGRSEASLAAAAEGYATTERLGVARTYGGLLLGFRTKAEFSLGRWDDADATSALGLRRGATDRAEVWISTNRARLLTARGRFADAARLLRRAREVDDRLGGTEFRSPLLAAEAELAMWQGRLADVRTIATEAIRLGQKPGPPDPSLAWLAATIIRAEADARAGGAPRRSPAADDPRLAEMLAQIDRAAELAATTTRELLEGSPRGWALLSLIQAERARLLGAKDPEAWARTADAWTAAGRPYPAAYARYREGAAVLAAGGARTTVTAALRAAADGARALGAAPLLGLVEQLARHGRIDLGADRTDRPGGDGDGRTASALGLTEREVEVLGLVAAGWTNQQIADALYITRKTASVHVSNILAKLEVDHRTGAAAVAHRLGLAGNRPPPGSEA
ncbi:MAG: helix-turn-helix transcriptional regulator [Chloroflexota bacterium]|nr:MAG: helix-turn-helix transcriptional regulator [Chloroflexota bacterium]